MKLDGLSYEMIFTIPTLLAILQSNITISIQFSNTYKLEIENKQL